MMGQGGTPANEVVATIGVAKDHATPEAWATATEEDCTSGWGAGDYSAACSPVGQIDEDADYNTACNIGGATTDATHYRRLTVAAAYRHEGDYPKNDVGAKQTAYVVIDEDYFEMEWLLVDAGSSMSGFSSVNVTGGLNVLIRQLIADVSTSGFAAYKMSPGNDQYTVVENCIGITRRDHNSAQVFSAGYQDDVLWRNCTGWGKGASNDEVFEYGEPTNCIGISEGSGTVFSSSEGSGDYNIGSDETAPGANSHDNKSAADLFADTTDTAEDLHLKAAVDGSYEGADLSASAPGFTDDIDGDTRSDWDIGADEIAAAGVNVPVSAVSGAAGVPGTPVAVNRTVALSG